MGLLSDLRHATRSLVHARGFTASVVLTLALGLALCTTAMVLVHAYLFSDLPYPAADRLYNVRYAAPGQDQPRRMSALDWNSLGDIVEHPIAWDLDAFYLLGGQNAEMVPGAWVTPGFVEGLGIRPVVGRGFDESSFRAGSSNVALISHRLWHARFGGDPSAIGQTFTAYVSDRPEEAERFTIIGVLPQDLWHFNPYTDILAPLRVPAFPYMVRLRPGVTPEQAAARITSLVASGASNVPQHWRAELVSAHGRSRRGPASLAAHGNDGGRTRAARSLRERRDPLPDPCHATAEGNCHSQRPWCRALGDRPHAPGRGVGRRKHGRGAGVVRDGHDASRDGAGLPATARAECAGRPVCGGVGSFGLDRGARGRHPHDGALFTGAAPGTTERLPCRV